MPHGLKRNVSMWSDDGVWLMNAPFGAPVLPSS